MWLDHLQHHTRASVPFSPSTRGKEYIWLVHLGERKWAGKSVPLPSSWWGDWPQSTRCPLSSLHTTHAGQAGRPPWSHSAVTDPEQECKELSMVKMVLIDNSFKIWARKNGAIKPPLFWEGPWGISGSLRTGSCHLEKLLTKKSPGCRVREGWD